MTTNPYKPHWDALENSTPRPRHLRSVKRIPFAEFKKKVYAADPAFVREIVHSLFGGDVYVLEGAYPKEFVEETRKKVFEWGLSTPSTFHKMLDGVPDFHRIIDESLCKNYSIETVRHTYYFFPWNSDPFNLFETVNDKWRVLKYVGGFKADEFEKNKPHDGVVDRIVVAHYPPGCGRQVTHSDPYMYQRAVLGSRFSHLGKDYETGGIYFVDQQGRERDFDKEVAPGDIYMLYPTVLHGVRTVDPHLKTDWNNIKGRWFLGVYSAVSDTVKDRHTGYGVKEEDYLSPSPKQG